MGTWDPAKEKLYHQFKRGEGSALAELLEGARAELYDYLLRMTGQITRSFDTIDEVFQALTEETLETIDHFGELQVCIYTTARKFNADIWNADTAKLTNPALEERQGLAVLDRALRSLPGPERETVLLGARAGFQGSEIAEIMGLSEEDVEIRTGTGRRRLEAECAAAGLKGGSMEAQLQRLPHHPLPARSTQATVNLSMVMQGIKAKPVGLSSPARLALLVVVVALIAAYVLYPDAFSRVIDLVRGGPSHRTGASGD